jgi:hypothetical protein
MRARGEPKPRGLQVGSSTQSVALRATLKLVNLTPKLPAYLSAYLSAVAVGIQSIAAALTILAIGKALFGHP